MLTNIIDLLVTDVDKFNELESLRRSGKLANSRARRGTTIDEERKSNLNRQMTQQIAYKRDKDKIRGEMKLIKRYVKAGRGNEVGEALRERDGD